MGVVDWLFILDTVIYVCHDVLASFVRDFLTFEWWLLMNYILSNISRYEATMLDNSIMSISLSRFLVSIRLVE
jgi:hypothetical protein